MYSLFEIISNYCFTFLFQMLFFMVSRFFPSSL